METETRRITMSPEDMELLHRTMIPEASQDELEVFKRTIERTGLDPFARQIYAQMRFDSNQGRKKISIGVNIDGFRASADGSGKYAGQLGPFWCGSDGEWKDVWLSDDPPVAAKVGILKHDFKEPLWAVANWNGFAQRTKDGGVSSMWKKMGPLMLAKCAEALGLRKAFPTLLSGLYTPEEMSQAETAPADDTGKAKAEPPPKAPAEETAKPPKKAASAPKALPPATPPPEPPPPPPPPKEAPKAAPPAPPAAETGEPYGGNPPVKPFGTDGSQGKPITYFSKAQLTAYQHRAEEVLKKPEMAEYRPQNEAWLNVINVELARRANTPGAE